MACACTISSLAVSNLDQSTPGAGDRVPQVQQGAHGRYRLPHSPVGIDDFNEASMSPEGPIKRGSLHASLCRDTCTPSNRMTDPAEQTMAFNTASNATRCAPAHWPIASVHTLHRDPAQLGSSPCQRS